MRKEQQEWRGEGGGEEFGRSRSRERLCSPEKEGGGAAQEVSSSPKPPPLPRKTVPPYQEYRFGPEESEPVLEKAGREKRRKKQAVRRMEQIIRSHNAGEEPEGMQTLDRDRDQSEGGENSRSREEGNRRR